MKIPGYFDTGAPDRAKRGKGRDAFHYEKGKFIMTPNFGIPPMNYI